MGDAQITEEEFVLPPHVLIELLELAKHSRRRRGNLLPLAVAVLVAAVLAAAADRAPVLEETVEVPLDLLSLEADPRPPVHVQHVVVHVLKLLSLGGVYHLWT